LPLPLTATQGQPLYLQLREHLRREIYGQAKPQFIVGGQLMPEAKIAKILQVSRGTVRQAIVDLAKEGLLVRRRGHGTQVVTIPMIEQDATQLEGLGESLQLRGIASEIVVLHHGLVTLSPSHPAAAALRAGPQLYYLERLRLVDKIPVAVDRSYFPPTVGQALEEHDVGSNAIYEILEEKLGLALTDADEWIRARKASRDIAQLLGLQIGAPILCLEKVVYQSDQTPLESATSLYPGDLYRYRIRARRFVKLANS
jgi:GntR family transcriptional regulator